MLVAVQERGLGIGSLMMEAFHLAFVDVGTAWIQDSWLQGSSVKADQSQSPCHIRNKALGVSCWYRHGFC